MRIADVTYNGEVIYQQHYVNVDGARYSLPLPEREFGEESDADGTREVLSYYVTSWEVAFMHLLEGGWDLNEGLRRAGIKVI